MKSLFGNASRCIRLVAAGVMTAGALLAVGEAVAAERPNIVQIMADDLGWGAVGYNGQKFVKTPHIDALSQEGLVFRRAYTAPVCSPTRASLQVGFHAGHTWTDWNIRWPEKGFRQRSVTIGKALKRAGYVTGAFGKWGFGGSDGQGDVLRSNPVIDNPETVPTHQGYDVFYGCLDHVRAHTFFMDSLWQSNPQALHRLELTPTGNTAANKFQRYCDDLYAEHAGRFLSQQIGGERPFYLQLHFQTPHSPLGQIAKLEAWFDAYGDVDTSDWPDAAKQYAAMVTRMDQHIGRLVAQLRDPNGDGDTSDSVVNETLIVFTSDNGGYRGAKFVEQFALNGPLRDGKGSLYEGGIRVPLVAYWPGTVQAGSHSDRPVCLTDLLPTFADLAGGSVPAGVDGVSLAPTLTGHGHQRPREFLAFEERDDWAIVRDSMKLMYHDRGQGRYELYDLEEDPREQHDLLEDRKENQSSRYAKIRSELRADAENAGVVHGSAIHRAEARANGKDAGEPHYVSFPQWIGRDGAELADAEHWDFEDRDFEDRDFEDGDFEHGPTPRAAWVATMRNSNSQPRTAKLAGRFQVLGIEIGGGDAAQTVRLERDAKLRGINEVRVADGGRLRLAGGTVGSDRWVEVLPGGKLAGRGRVDATLHSGGRLSANGLLIIAGDYRPTQHAVTQLTASSEPKHAPLTLDEGTLHAAGRLVVRLGDDYQPQSGDVVPVIDAASITGRFDEVALPELTSGNKWDASKLYENGTLTVD